MTTSQLLVVGASCVGGMTAKTAAQKGLRTTLLEEHGKPGKFNHCTAICNKRGLDSLGVRYQPTVLHHVRGAVVHTPNARVRIDAKRTVAEVFDRQAFDEQCVKEAVDAGATLATKAQLRGLQQNENFVNAQTAAGDFESEFLIGADGATSATATLAGFPAVKLKDHAFTWQGTFENASLEHPEFVDVLLDNKKFPEFFAWLVPCGPDSCRVGLGTTRPNALQAGIRALLKHDAVSSTIAGARKTFEFYHPIPLAVRKRTQLGRVLLAGDAAGQVKSTTGGGIVFGGLCGQLAAEAVADAVNGEPLDYEQRWKKQHARPLRAHRALHLGYRLAVNPLLDLAANTFSLLGLNNALARFGDMDRLFRASQKA